MLRIARWWVCFALAACSNPQPEAAPAPVLTADTLLTPVSAEAVQGLLRAHPGKVVLVNLWSTWCAPCMAEMPMLVQLTRGRHAEGLGAVFISMDLPVNEAEARAFMAESGAPAPSYIRAGRDGEFIEAVHPDWSGTLPATILLDANRRPRHIWTGEADPAVLGPAIDALLAEE